MKKLLGVLVSLFASVVLAVPAAANTVTRTPLPTPDPVTITNACSFAFRVDFLKNREVLTEFRNNNNQVVKWIVTGYLLDRFTNLSTGKSIVENVSGPGIYIFNADGSITLRLPGPQAGSLPDGRVTWQGFGYIILKIAPNGMQTIVKEVGNFSSSCDLLS